MATRAFGEPPVYGLVERDKDSGIVIMWIGPDERNSRNWRALVVEPGRDGENWVPTGDVERNVSWLYVGWEKVD